MKNSLGYSRIECQDNVAKVSLLGVGVFSNQRIACQMFRTLSDAGIVIIMVITSEMEISCLIPGDELGTAIQVLCTMSFLLGVRSFLLPLHFGATDEDDEIILCLDGWPPQSCREQVGHTGVESMDTIWTRLQTEQASERYRDLDEHSTLGILRLMNEADKQVPLAVERALPQIARAVDLIVERMHGGGRLIYLGAGTSGRLAVLDAAECPPTFNTPQGLVWAVIAGGRQAMFEAVEESEDHPEWAERDLQSLGLSNQDVLVGIAASGRTPYVIGGLQYAERVGAGRISLCCNPDAIASRYAQVAIEVVTGPEVLMGSTRMKAGTAQKMVLNMLSTATMVRLGKVYQNLMVDLRATNEKLVERSKRIIMLATGLEYVDAAKLLADAGGSVKTAIVMHEKHVPREQAEDLLAAAQGRLRQVLERRE
ncbi:MAG: N-acetylmuramic acid 6-phosphate etherase [Alicyclobacillus shizuokensis]|nr:N-acetylmuramic acid 6-phosphate etherase [Alicyclobacillus shizuokensis]